MSKQAEIIQTTAVDISSQEFQSWYYQNTIDVSNQNTIDVSKSPEMGMPRTDHDGAIEDNYPDRSTSTLPLPQISTTKSFYAYSNSRGSSDWNTCGQAAIATMLDYHNRDPFGLPRNERGRWDSGSIIDSLKAAGWGTDVVFGWGTTGTKIADALRYYGLNQVYVEASGLFGSGREQWDKLKYFLRVLQTPVPVLLDMGFLNPNQGFTAHWPVAYKINSADEIYLGNCWGGKYSVTGTSFPACVVDRDTFLKAWNCRFLPLGFNFCGIYYWRAWG